MPELPEVETTCRGIEPHLKNLKIKNVIVRQAKLRWPVNLPIQELKGQTIRSIQRRAKYLLMQCDTGTMIWHLGMSGCLRILDSEMVIRKHDHIDIVLEQQKILRFTDPRRFGALLWTEADPLKHFLLCKLGVEPLTKQFSAKYLKLHLQKTAKPIKSVIMDHHVVVGVGNIYATEALFLTGIHPKTVAKNLTDQQIQSLVFTIKKVLRQGIAKGGTTLRDFLNSDGKPGYFSHHLKVYGREGLACYQCNTILEKLCIGQRSTVYCRICQRYT